MDEGRNKTRGSLADDVDTLFKLPLAQFTGARNDLVARLKRDGRADDANLVKALAKPSISAWAVNQLHWNHRKEFDRLLETGQSFRQAQTSAGRIAEVRGSLDARREALSTLSDLASALLRDAGHSPTPDTIHRITTTLEALSVYATTSDGPTPGRLTQDVDPPGLESLASLFAGIDTTKRGAEPARATPSQRPGTAAPKTRQKASPPGEEDREEDGEKEKARQANETRRAAIAAAKVTLQEARKSLADARSTAQRLEAVQKKAHAEAKEAEAEAGGAEKQLRQAEDRFKKASATSQEASDRAQRIAAETREAAQAVEEARRTIEKASKELESLIQGSPAR
jgi:DNA repair exonuclease SbcCD ATPase subunit